MLPDFEKSRRLATTHYLIGNALLYDNKDCAEEQAIEQYIHAVNILVNHIKSKLPEGDQTDFKVPTKENFKVDRFCYLPKPFDNEYITELKQTIFDVLDKIEDTHDQIGSRETLKKEKEMAKQQQSKFSVQEFEKVPEGTKIVNLGVFGNRKRPPEKENQSSQENSTQKPKTESVTESKI